MPQKLRRFAMRWHAKSERSSTPWSGKCIHKVGKEMFWGLRYPHTRQNRMGWAALFLQYINEEPRAALNIILAYCVPSFLVFSVFCWLDPSLDRLLHKYIIYTVVIMAAGSHWHVLLEPPPLLHNPQKARFSPRSSRPNEASSSRGTERRTKARLPGRRRARNAFRPNEREHLFMSSSIWLHEQ